MFIDNFCYYVPLSMNTTKKYREKLSFERAMLNLGTSGISTPYTPQVLSYFKVPEKVSLGLFGANGNPNTFYPGLDVPEEVMPKPEDFIRVPFRLLSATVVGAGTWKATDFSNAKILKESFGKLKSKPVYTDHDTSLMNWAGIVEEVTWEDKKGDVPGGINGLLAIDAKTNPKIARGVLLKAIFSNSVTVEFDWVPSHSFDDPYEFQNKIGTLHPTDGKMIRRVVTEIFDYHETSLVWLGADPYAKMLDDNGSLVNIDESSTYNLEKEKVKNEYEKEGKFSISFSLPQPVYKNRNNLISIDMNKEFELALRKLLGLGESEELKSEQLSKLTLSNPEADKALENFKKLEAFNSLGDAIEKPSEVKEGEYVMLAKTDFDGLRAASTEVEQLKTEKSNLETEKAALETEANFGKSVIEAKKNEAIRLYKIQAGKNEDESVIELISSAKPNQLDGLLKQYGKSVSEQFTGTCNDCGSHKVEFRSSTEDGEDGNEGESNVESASFSDLMAKYDKPSMFPGKNSKK